MRWPDVINGILECGGGLFIALSIRQLFKDKVVRGVSWLHVAFFSSWGFWNLYYYPYLGQWLSFVGGAWLAAMNTIWLGQIVYYNISNRMNRARAIRQGDKFWGKFWGEAELIGFDGDAPIDGKRYRHRDK